MPEMYLVQCVWWVEAPSPRAFIEDFVTLSFRLEGIRGLAMQFAG